MDSQDTRSRVLEAAKQVVAEQGVTRATLREITRRAGVNLAAVNYHFGTKDQLLESIMLSALRPIYENRGQRLMELRRQASLDGGRVSLDSILHAYLEPVLNRIEEYPNEGTLECQIGNYLFYERGMNSAPELVETIRASILIFADAIVECEPGLDRRRVAAQLFYSSQLIVFMTINSKVASRLTGFPAKGLPSDRQRLLKEFKSFAATAVRLAPEV